MPGFDYNFDWGTQGNVLPTQPTTYKVADESSNSISNTANPVSLGVDSKVGGSGGGGGGSMLPGAFQIGLGAYQMYQGYKMRKEADAMRKDAMFKIPASATESLDRARSRASQTKMPGQEMMEKQIAGDGANYMANVNQFAGSGTQAIAGAGRNQVMQNDALRKLAVQSAQYNANEQRNLQSQLGQMASLQQKEWEINKYKPWQDTLKQASAMKGSGIQNMYGGLTSITPNMEDVSKMAKFLI